MGPESHLVVCLLRFLNYTIAANLYRNMLIGTGGVTLHPQIIKAVDEIVKRNKNDNSFFKREQFEQIAQEFGLYELPNGGIESTDPNFSILSNMGVKD